MATPSSYDFETFYHAVCSDLNNKGEVQNMSKQFSLLGDDNDRIKFVLEKNFAGSVHWRDFNYSPKDRSESQKLRNLGNQVYQKNRLHIQYYFNCACQPCNSNWPVYSSLSQAAVPVAGTAPEQAKQIVSEHHKAAKQYKKAFDFVLTGKLSDSSAAGFAEALPVLTDHLTFLDRSIQRPLREYNDCQEAIKQVWSLEGNCFRTKGGKEKKEKEMIV